MPPQTSCIRNKEEQAQGRRETGQQLRKTGRKQGGVVLLQNPTSSAPSRAGGVPLGQQCLPEDILVLSPQSNRWAVIHDMTHGFSVKQVAVLIGASKTTCKHQISRYQPLVECKRANVYVVSAYVSV